MLSFLILVVVITPPLRRDPRLQIKAKARDNRVSNKLMGIMACAARRLYIAKFRLLFLFSICSNAIRQGLDSMSYLPRLEPYRASNWFHKSLVTVAQSIYLPWHICTTPLR